MLLVPFPFPSANIVSFPGSSGSPYHPNMESLRRIRSPAASSLKHTSKVCFCREKMSLRVQRWVSRCRRPSLGHFAIFRSSFSSFHHKAGPMLYFILRASWSPVSSRGKRCMCSLFHQITKRPSLSRETEEQAQPKMLPFLSPINRFWVSLLVLLPLSLPLVVDARSGSRGSTPSPAGGG